MGTIEPVSARGSWWLCAWMCLLGMACGSSSRQGSKAAPKDEPSPLRIAAASDLLRALPPLTRRFEERTGVKTTLTFDASGRLSEQIKAGAPFDVFLAANLKFVDDLAAAGLILKETVRPYARGSLVLCVPSNMAEPIKGIADLRLPGVKKIAIANPDYAPYGVAARQALGRAGLWDELQSKLVRADSARQALTYLRTGDVEAALASRALIEGPEIRGLPVDPGLYDPLIQALGVVAGSSQAKRAEEFVKYVLEGEGRSMLHEAGFDEPAAPPPSTVKSDALP